MSPALPHANQLHAVRDCILPGQELRTLVQRGAIVVPGAGLDSSWEQRLQPAGLDLRLGAKAWRVRASFLPTERRGVRQLVEEYASHEIRLSGGTILEVGGVYIAELAESLALPHHLSGRTSAKSSIGRLNVFTRLITEHGAIFDEVPLGYHGPLYAEIAPCSFPVFLREGLCLNQLRILEGEPRASSSATLKVDLSGDSTFGIAGFRAQKYTSVLDLAQENHHEAELFWDAVPATRERRLVLDPNAFYILVSEPAVRVASDQAGELEPFSANMGEFRVNYAGFFDPGFGAETPEPARAVLEVRSREVPFILESGQAVGHLVSYPLAATAERPYAHRGRPGYERQTLTLSRHFKPWRNDGRNPNKR